ncbi:nucleotide exchange factor GrpE [bacterium]|jgi:molecular chaperone GrpE|nr:nucleotide exchange factor GrpE [bacterium]
MMSDDKTQEQVPVNEDSSLETSKEQPEEVVEETDPLILMQEERDQFRDQFLRTAAEMENYRKRVNRERDEDRKYSKFSFISELLPAMDNLQRAIDSAANDEAAAGLLQGVQMVLKQFEEILSRNGAEPIEAMGQPFDPNFHEAIQQRPTADVEPMTVVEVLERGIKLHDRVIRPSKVIVSTEPVTEE